MPTYLAVADCEAQHEQTLAFLKANGLNAYEIPADDGLRIVGDEIHYSVFADGMGARNRSDWRTTPLVSPPEEHGLTVRSMVPREELVRKLEAGGCPPELAEQLVPVVQGYIARETN